MFLASADVGAKPGFNRNVEAALASIKVPVLYLPSETGLYFLLADARYEAAFLPRGTLLPIPSLCGHPAGAGGSAEDVTFLNAQTAAFLGLLSAPR